MTLFMNRVADLIGGDAEVEVPPMPPTRISQRIASMEGADRQVALRALAEQLVCEANAVMAHEAELMSLTDETLPDELAFNVTYRGRAVRVSTKFTDHTAYARLVGDGFEFEEPRELDDPEALPDLMIRLLVEAGLPQHTAYRG